MQDFNTIIEAVTRLEEKVISLTEAFWHFREEFQVKKEKPAWLPVAGIVVASIFSWLTFLTWAILRMVRPG